MTKNTRRPEYGGDERRIEKYQLPDIEVRLNLAYPERSRVFFDGKDTGATQIELRTGKVSANEVVFRVPRDRVHITFVEGPESEA